MSDILKNNQDLNLKVAEIIDALIKKQTKTGVLTNININPGIKGPEIKVDPGIKGPEIKVDPGIKGPEIKGPEIKGPEIKVDPGIKEFLIKVQEKLREYILKKQIIDQIKEKLVQINNNLKLNSFHLIEKIISELSKISNIEKLKQILDYFTRILNFPNFSYSLNKTDFQKFIDNTDLFSPIDQFFGSQVIGSQNIGGPPFVQQPFVQQPFVQQPFVHQPFVQQPFVPQIIGQPGISLGFNQQQPDFQILQQKIDSLTIEINKIISQQTNSDDLKKQMDHMKTQMDELMKQITANVSTQQMNELMQKIHDPTQLIDDLKNQIVGMQKMNDPTQLTQKIDDLTVGMQQKIDKLQQKMDDCCDSTSSSHLDDFKQLIKNRLMHILFKQLIKNKLSKLIGSPTVSPTVSPTNTSQIPLGSKKSVSSVK